MSGGRACSLGYENAVYTFSGASRSGQRAAVPARSTANMA